MKHKKMKKEKKKANSEPVNNSKKKEEPKERPGEFLTNNKRGSNSAGVQKDEILKNENERGCSDSRNNIVYPDLGNGKEPNGNDVSDEKMSSGDKGEDNKDVCRTMHRSFENVGDDFVMIQNKEEINSDNVQTKSGHKQRLQPGLSRETRSRKIQSSGSTVQQGSQEPLSSATDHSGGESFCHNNPNPSTSKTDRSSICCENDSDLESIPTVSYFKQRAWIGRQSGVKLSGNNQSSFDENRGTKRSFDTDGYVDGMWQGNRLIKLDSCEFTHPYENRKVYIRKQSPGYLFTFDEDDFIARVCFDKLERLDFSGHPVDIKRDFLRKLIITELIRDKLSDDSGAIYNHFIELLQDRSSKTADNLDWAEDIFQVSLILEKYGLSYNNASILENIIGNDKISSEMINRSKQLRHTERITDRRRQNFPQVGQFDKKNLLEELRRICKGGVNNHRNAISGIAPFILENHINVLDDKLIPYITKKDMGLFADLADMMSEEPYIDFLNNLWDVYFQKIKKIREHAQVSSLRDFAPLTHPIYFYLCKSFRELVEEIGRKTDLSANDLLKNKNTEWSLPEIINWSTTSHLTQSLEQQYRFIFKMMEHFRPGCYSDRKKFDKTAWQRTKDLFSSIFSSKESSATPQERLVWIRIFENTIDKIVSKEELKLFEPLLKGYTDFIVKTEHDQYESFRIVMHSTVRFIAQTCPYFSKNISEIDRHTLTKQIEFINKTISDKQFNDFRDLIDAYNEYWKNRETIIEKIPDKFPYGEFKKDMESIRQKLHNIVNTALVIAAEPQGLIKYFRSFNEFVEDLSAVEYSWFVNDISNVTQDEVTLINEKKKSYKILDPEQFIKNHSNIPRHYVIEIIQDLLNSVIDLLDQRKWSNHDNLNAASVLISAIKKSFCYLKDQPTYVSFDTFKDESIVPFSSVIENSSSYADFEKRVDIIGESFWYLRKQDEIDIEKALDLYKQSNGNSTLTTETILRDCYKRYLNKFDSYIKNTSNENDQDKIKLITQDLNGQFIKTNISKWEKKFKNETLPDLLAGLAAVWSVQASKDIAATGKSLKPHCIQILCILRLLSIDKDSNGVDKHLAQVLTGQGKSLVLGLLSALLTLMGHRVRTVCYSEYLATRDRQDFGDFFETFHIYDKVAYGTFEEMANETLQPEINGKKQSLRELIIDRVLNHSTKQSGHVKQNDISNTILLIDEVDVFFSDQFYGNTYSAACRINIPALVSIQEKIWESVSKNDEISTVLTEVEEFIQKKKEERADDIKEFIKFLYKPSKYYILIEHEGKILKKDYTNRSLYEEHLKKMIENARNVARGNDENWYISDYKINDDGYICCRRNDGLYSAYTISSYYNVFNYFRLKKRDYDYKNYRNYGYLVLDSGAIAYAKLPEKYPLILGVSGTLTTLNDHEKKAIRESYKIDRNSIMPSYFGHSNLKFDKNNDFVCYDSKENWLSKIFSHANSKIGSGRSVLIFFDTDKEIDNFENRFLGKFDRLYILTENTEQRSKKKYIDEAGIKKTLTLATRGMGRGVDFKSSVAVERNGGVHVIQTFFSLDIKEETQIKGRTARKDNKGSYELILCTEHLIRDGFAKKEEVSATVDYQSLNRAREVMVKEKGSNNETRIKKSEDNHKTTMDFFGSFFGGDFD
nr:uncharacterized protein LOC117219077 [Megalopta genalis]XP_033323857.1 uncharacterized protein LOC117219077 [Megalopta genalis]XP_033323858.1 uncharacterized protein LOC117219077 [Megalopta genalis]